LGGIFLLRLAPRLDRPCRQICVHGNILCNLCTW
jgi:hypothetical protein